ncbi:uncharacterized protein LOC110844621 [Folsomia candida]|uniref:uncharacterized protein LOC110844621 n=1 Tax=Folsomia candida TaxID=158441 RepID=UPI000B908F41|nr:uncharacterized protein LOC110844621 [Folsomia candida]
MGFSYKNICIQLLPVLRTAYEAKLLLVKWRHGPYKDRYTGMMKITHYEADYPPTKKILADIAKDLVPAKSNITLNSLDLVALLSFPDPPAYDEYVFLGDVNAVSYYDSKEAGFPGLVGDNRCIWCDLKNIPYAQMPADDALWYPKVLQDPPTKVIGNFRFRGPQMRHLDRYVMSEIAELRWVGDGTGFFSR